MKFHNFSLVIFERFPIYEMGGFFIEYRDRACPCPPGFQGQNPWLCSLSLMYLVILNLFQHLKT